MQSRGVASLLPADAGCWLPQWSHRVAPSLLQGEFNLPSPPPQRVRGAGPRALCSAPPTRSSLGQPRLRLEVGALPMHSPGSRVQRVVRLNS